MKSQVELINLFWTTAGMLPGTGEISRFDFRDRVESAARAGFKGIGIWHTDLEHCTLHRSLKEMKMILDDNDIKYVELEFLVDWFGSRAGMFESDSRKKILFEASEALNAKHVKMGDFYNSVWPMDGLIEAFAKLCAEAEDFGATIAFELMSSSMINNLADALTMVESARAKNAGIILDIIQIVNLGISHDEIKRIPLKYLINFELNDGIMPGRPNQDAANTRRYCGEGDFDIKGLIQCADQMGFTGPWAIEVMPKDSASSSLDSLASRAFETSISQFTS